MTKIASPEPANSSTQAANAAPPRAPQTDEQRREELARLLPIWPTEAADLTAAGRRHIIRHLERALRAERRRGRAGHWAYNVSRHAALIAIWKNECAALRALQFRELLARSQKSPPKGGRF